MEFKLTYHGPLWSTGNRSTPNKSAKKHLLRTAFHSQLETLWSTQPTLCELRAARHTSLDDCWDPGLVGNFDGGLLDQPDTKKPYIDLLVDEYGSKGVLWAPLVTKRMGLQCSVEILFLRNGMPGEVLRSGDIDGRLKTVFDALCIPTTTDGIELSKCPRPMFCVLDDDSQISSVSVQTDQLLERSIAPVDHEARLVVTVKIWPRVSNLFTVSWV